jgi:hypothetical protein
MGKIESPYDVPFTHLSLQVHTNSNAIRASEWHGNVLSTPKQADKVIIWVIAGAELKM